MTQYNIILSVHTEKQEIKVKLSKILQIDYSLVIMNSNVEKNK